VEKFGDRKTLEKTGAKILIVGLGDLGSCTLEYLSREESVGSIVVGTRNAFNGLGRSNLARIGAIAQGYNPEIKFVPLDLCDRDAVAEVVVRESPDIVIHTATMMSWWLPKMLPEEPAERLAKAGFGVWLPVHQTLTLKLMMALRKADFSGFVLTAPFPDVINCVLGNLGLAPTCGVGNLAEVVPKIQALLSKYFRVKPSDAKVYLVAHHSFEAAVFSGVNREEAPPYFLRVECDGQDVTEPFRAHDLLWEDYPTVGGRAVNFLTAACLTRLVRALTSTEESLLHVPAPDGLPGGYPVLVSREGVKLAPVSGLSKARAISINEQSHRFDGIERVEEDGTVVFVPESADVLKRELGYNCSKLSPSDSEDRARELLARFKGYAERFGVQV